MKKHKKSVIQWMAVFALGAFLTGFTPTLSPLSQNTSEGLLLKSLKLIQRQYYDQTRIQPKAMMEKGLYALAELVPELGPDFSVGNDSLKLKVGAQSQTFQWKPFKRLTDLDPVMKEIFVFIQKTYTGDIPLQEMEYAFIDGMLEVLDPHSRFFPPVQNEDFQAETEGKYGGVGLVIGYEDYKIYVVSPVEGTPGFKAGIKPLDVILQIDDYSTVNMSTTEAVDLMRGEPKTPVTLKILSKDGQVKDVTLVREVIEIQSIESKVIEAKPQSLGVLRIKSFQGNTMEEFYEQLQKLPLKELKGLVVDLRNNSGGYLQTAIRISDRFLKEGEIVSTHYENQIESKAASAQLSDIDLPLVVLINEASASAAEIVAGALKNNQRALVLGRDSFGKGSVQQVYDNPDESSIKMTVAEYLTPGQKSIQAVGIVPDIYVYPAKVGETQFDLKENVYYSEQNLEAHFENRFKAVEQTPLHRFSYLQPEKKEDPTDNSFIIKIKEEEDYELRLAIEILKEASSAKREAMLSAGAKVVEKEKASQAKLMSEALLKKGIDWSSGQKGDGQSLFLEYTFLDAQNQKVFELAAGQTYTLELKLKNQSQDDLRQVLATIDSFNPVINNKEFVFGTLGPLETKTQTLTLEIPHVMSSFEEKSTLKVYTEKSQNNPKEFALQTLFKEKLAPQLSYAYELFDGGAHDSRGNQNGLPEIGEKIVIKLNIKNEGPTEALETMVSLRNESKNAIFLNKARETLGVLKALEQKSVLFDFEVKALPEDEKYKFDFYAVDNQTQANLTDTIVLHGKEKSRFSPIARTWQKQPQIALSKDSQARDGFFRLQGEVMDEKQIKDLSVFVEGQKLYFENFLGATPLNKKAFTIDLPLKDGLNTIVVKARGERDMPVYKTFSVVHHKDPKPMGLKNP